MKHCKPLEEECQHSAAIGQSVCCVLMQRQQGLEETWLNLKLDASGLISRCNAEELVCEALTGRQHIRITLGRCEQPAHTDSLSVELRQQSDRPHTARASQGPSKHDAVERWSASSVLCCAAWDQHQRSSRQYANMRRAVVVEASGADCVTGHMPVVLQTSSA